MINEIIIALLLIIFFFVIRYIVKAMAKGKTCIGCPYSGNCRRQSACASGKPDNVLGTDAVTEKNFVS